jgi:hypothetical protein
VDERLETVLAGPGMHAGVVDDVERLCGIFAEEFVDHVADLAGEVAKYGVYEAMNFVTVWALPRSTLVRVRKLMYGHQYM